jgi:hypothetical protein
MREGGVKDRRSEGWRMEGERSEGERGKGSSDTNSFSLNPPITL